MGDTSWTVIYKTETHTATCTNSKGCVGEARFKVTVYNKPIPFIAGDNVICQGTSTVITASGGRSYLWNTGSRAAAIRVAPTVTTTYYVTVTGDGGCSETDSIVIYVIPRPTPSVTVGDDSIPLTQTSICRGSEVTLMAQGAGNKGTYFWLNASSTCTTSEP